MTGGAPSRVGLLQGPLGLLILRTPACGAKHIQRTSEDLLQVETGSLYPALHRLEAIEWLAPSWELSNQGKRGQVLSPARAWPQTACDRRIKVAGLLLSGIEVRSIALREALREHRAPRPGGKR